MKLTPVSYWSLFLFIFISNQGFQTHGQSLTIRKNAQGSISSVLETNKKSRIIRSSSKIPNPDEYNLQFKKSEEDKKKYRSKVKLTSNKKELHVLNQHPDSPSVYEIPFNLDIKKPERVKKKKINNPDKSLSKKSSTSLSKPAPTYSILDPRTLMMAPLLAAPVVFAEVMTLGGVGLAAPAVILLPFLLAPLIVIAFIMFV